MLYEKNVSTGTQMDPRLIDADGIGQVDWESAGDPSCTLKTVSDRIPS